MEETAKDENDSKGNPAEMRVFVDSSSPTPSEVEASLMSVEHENA